MDTRRSGSEPARFTTDETDTAMAKLWMALLALVSVLVSLALADDPAERATLAGLAGVRVVVDDVEDDVEDEGLTQSALQRDVELKLQQAGIRVLTEAEWRAAPGKPTLELEINTLKPQTKTYLFSITLDLAQEVRLERDTNLSSHASTWSATPRLGAALAAHLPRAVRRHVQEMVDQFVNAYLAANPKR